MFSFWPFKKDQSRQPPRQTARSHRVRLKIEPLETRDVMSAGIIWGSVAASLADGTPIGDQVEAAMVRQVELTGITISEAPTARGLGGVLIGDSQGHISTAAVVVAPGNVDGAIFGDRAGISPNGVMFGDQVPNGVVGAAGVMIGDQMSNGVIVGDGVLFGDQLSNGVIVGDKLVNGVIVGDRLANGVIIGDQLRNDPLIGDQLPNGVIIGDRLANGVIIGDRLANGVIISNGLEQQPNGITIGEPNSVLIGDQLPAGVIVGDQTMLSNGVMAGDQLPAGVIVGDPRDAVAAFGIIWGS